MIFKDIYDKAKDKVSSAFHRNFEDEYEGPKGEVFITLEHEDGRVEEYHIENVITKDFSILLARLCKDSIEPRHGILALAVGTGDTGWDLQNPPSPTDTQRSLYSEIERKKFSTTEFLDSGGSTSSIPTNIIELTTIFQKTEAVGPIVEMGLLGGDVNEDMGVTNPVTPANGTYDDTEDLTGQDTLCNYKTFPVINKPNTAVMTFTWRITL